MMTSARWLLVFLLVISPLAYTGQTNPATAAKQKNKQLNSRGTKQQQQQRPPGTTATQQQQKQANVKVSSLKKPIAAKQVIATKINAGIKQGEKLEQKINTLQQQLKDAQTKQATLKQEQLKREKEKAAAEAKAKAQAPRVFIKQPVLSTEELERPTNALRCGKTGNFYCISETKCCRTGNHEWACCPKPSAVCCQDKTHCCPQGTTCDLQKGQCRGQKAQTSPLMRKINAIRLPAGTMVCPDHRSSCPDHFTCCLAPYGGFNCCPAAQAMCCPDKQHCCPHGSRCDPRRGRCDRGNKVAVPWFTKVPARPVAFGQILCPGGQFECPTGTSCCRLESGDWGCCPLPKAVCCADGVHCCPSGYTCNAKMGTCQKEDEDVQFVHWMNLTDKYGQPPTPPNTICPSGKYKCPSDQSCCERKGGLYGCCPFVEGTCCSDEKHCCPKGYECDLEKSKCIKGKGSVLLLSTLRASLDIRVPTSYQQLENFLNTGYLPAPSTSKSPVFDNLAKLKKMQTTEKEPVAQTAKIKTPNLQLKQSQQQKVQTPQPQQARGQNVQIKQQKKQNAKTNPQQQVLTTQQQNLKQQQMMQAQQIKLKQQQQLHQAAQKSQQQQVKKPVAQPKPVIQQAKVVNKTPQGQRQVPQNKPFLNNGNRVDLKRLDPKMAEASRKAKIAIAVTKNAQILRKLHSVDLNVPTQMEQVTIKPLAQNRKKAKPQSKTQGGAFNVKLQPTLTEQQIKNAQKIQSQKLQQNAKQKIAQQKHGNAQTAKKQVKPNVAQAKH